MQIQGWFPKTNQQTLEMLIKEYNIETVIEIGSFVGLSTVWLAERVKKVITIDPFDAITRINYLHGEMKEAAENQLENFKKNTEKFSNIQTIVGTSEKAEKFLHDVKVDLIYIDGSHEYEDVKKDIEIWLPHANKVICGDDYTESWPGVRRAVDECDIPMNKNQRCWYHVKM